MNRDFKQMLSELNADFTEVKGQPFSNFFCPILFEDDDVPLCEAHIVNKAFANVAPDWVIQRTDVDNFYGSVVESDFVITQHKGQAHDNILFDQKLSKALKPQILLDNKPVEYFVAHGDIPNKFSRIEFENNGKVIQLGLKISPEEFLKTIESKWEIAISKDIRVSSVVSLIKAGHLTLFKKFGYRYALSAGGYFIGRNVLGEFFLQNVGKSKKEASVNAYSFFKEYAHMVRPLHSSEINFQGTISDNQMLVCQKRGDIAWGVIVFVKTPQATNAILLPLFDQPESVIRFFNFLKDDNETIDVALLQFRQENLELIKTTKIIWPKSGTLYPD